MKVLITGGAGFIGRATAALLAAHGHRVLVLDNLSPQVHGRDAAFPVFPAFPAFPAAVSCVRGDVRNRDLLAALLPGVDRILHLAAETGTGQSMYAIEHYCSVNMGGTAALLQALNDTPHQVAGLVVASSRAIYGEGRYSCPAHGFFYPGRRDPALLAAGRFDPPCPECRQPMAPAPTPEDAPADAASIYAVSKLAQEKLVLAFAAAHGLPAFALRYQNVWGKGQSLTNPYTGILSIFSTLMRKDAPIEIFEDGLESRDFVHISDVAQANLLALSSGEPGQNVVNVGSGRALSVLEVVQALAAAYGYRRTPRISGRFRAGDIRHNFADLGRARRLLPGFAPTPFAAHVGEFARWVESLPAEGDAAARYRQSLAELEQRGLMGSAPEPPAA